MQEIKVYDVDTQMEICKLPYSGTNNVAQMIWYVWMDLPVVGQKLHVVVAATSFDPWLIP